MTNSTAYRYYRIYITATFTDTYVKIAELEMMEGIVE